MPKSELWTMGGEQHLDVEELPIYVTVENMDQYADQFAMIRKTGLGGSDSSALLGVSPYTTREELEQEKARDYLLEEEKEVGDLANVRKGNELEPLIIKKASEALQLNVLKPSDMYRFEAYPHLTMNFDGVNEQPWEDPVDGRTGKYVSNEIKVLTTFGEKHYSKVRAFFQGAKGFQDMPDRIDKMNASIKEKAAQYGIPPYYYTQVQQENLAAGRAPFSYLSILSERDWQLYIWLIWRDDQVQNDIVVESFKAWQKITELRGPDFKLEELNNIPIIGYNA